MSFATDGTSAAKNSAWNHTNGFDPKSQENSITKIMLAKLVDRFSGKPLESAVLLSCGHSFNEDTCQRFFGSMASNQKPAPKCLTCLKEINFSAPNFAVREIVQTLLQVSSHEGKGKEAASNAAAPMKKGPTSNQKPAGNSSHISIGYND